MEAGALAVEKEAEEGALAVEAEEGALGAEGASKGQPPSVRWICNEC